MTTLILLLAVQDARVPAEYLEAERVARATLELLGVSTDGVEVRYENLGSKLHGDQLGRIIRVNPNHYPESVRSVYHEFWHYFQQEAMGGSDKFLEEYGRHPYDSNPFEYEARIFADHMEHLVRLRRSPFARGASFEAQVATLLDRMFHSLVIEKSWRYLHEPISLVRLDVAEKLEDLPRAPLPGEMFRQALFREVGAAGHFAAAWLLKESLKAVETGDLAHIRTAALQLKEPRFWGNLAVFSVAARGAEKLPLKGLARATVPLTVGVAAVQFLSGNYSLKDLGITTGSFLATGALVNLIADGLVYPILFASGPPGLATVGLYTVGKLAVTLYAGEKLEGWIHQLLREKGASESQARDGIRTKVERIGGTP